MVLGKLLLMAAVGSHYQTMDLLMAGVNHLRMNYKGQVDVFLMHYDNSNSAWLDRNASWYEGNVQNSSFASGIKWFLVKKEIDSYQKIGHYSWVWVMDEDVDITKTDVSKMIALASESGSPIVGPAILSPPGHHSRPVGRVARLLQESANFRGRTDCQPGDHMCRYQVPDPGCRWSYTRFIEVMTPLLRPQALWQVVQQCDACITELSTWGLNSVWCSIAAKTAGLPRDRGCSLIDQTPIVHTNYRSHIKYTSTEGSKRKKNGQTLGLHSENVAQRDKVRSLFPNDYVETEVVSWKPICVP